MNIEELAELAHLPELPAMYEVSGDAKYIIFLDCRMADESTMRALVDFVHNCLVVVVPPSMPTPARIFEVGP